MAGKIDYAQLRDQTLGSAQEEEAVTVNTRALIDKVLARYSGEWTTFRELIQNSADATATKVSIKFETLPSATVPTPSPTTTAREPAEHIKHVILNHTLKRVVVSNDGQHFDEYDWARLKRIAEGNPDETKIGAFGVGFYSVFADCENPFVTSGKDTMAFYWKGNSLFTRRGKLPADHPSSDTTFVLDYRNQTSSIPNLLSICQFLSTSLTFIALQRIELWLDDWNLFTLLKKTAPANPITIPKEIDPKSKQGILKITSVESQNGQIDATWMNIVGWKPTTAVTTKPGQAAAESESKAPPSLRQFFSRLAGSSYNNAMNKRAAKEEEATQRAIAEDLVGHSTATVFIRVSTAHVKSQVPSSFAAELQRATKKPPPKTTKVAVLNSSFDETSASLATLNGTASSKAAEIITSILPTKSGRIFIGFPTAQTTGLLAHISAPSLIPTVERESIDLNARWVRDWNSELLNIAGISCRLAYNDEMALLRRKANSDSKGPKSDSVDEDALAALQPAAVHTLKQYTFQESTPLPRAGQLIEEAFWTCSKKTSIEMFSSQGILPSHQIRIASEDLSFVNKIPVIPEKLMKDAYEFVSKLQEFGLISDITTTDIRNELEKQALSEQQLIEFLKWSSHKVQISELDTAAISSLFKVTVANVNSNNDDSGAGSVIILRDIKTFLNSQRIPPENPTPPHTIPFRVTKDIRLHSLQSLGWEELQIVPWLRWLLDASNTKELSIEHDMASSPIFSGHVLGVISKAWDSISQSSKSTIVELLTSKTVMPTKLGMKIPSDSYFPSVKLFDDLPTISGIPAVKDKFLKALGVRKTIELSVIFERLMNTSKLDTDDGSKGWSHVELIRYLVSVWSDIPQQDIVQLRNTSLCPAEQNGDPKKGTSQHFKVSELFEPTESLRALGVPILQWPTPFNGYSNEGKFLKLLGLRPYPSVPELVNIMVKANSQKQTALYDQCLNYFIENHYSNNYGSFDMRSVSVPFLPLENGEPNKLVKPADCFTNNKAQILLFPILRKDLQPHGTKFGVQSNPPIAECAARLIRRPPQNRVDAKEIFTYFAGRLTDISDQLAQKLGSSLIVPLVKPSRLSVLKEGASPVETRLVAPTTCFLGEGQEYRDIFDYVDFGPEPNVFLLKIGSKHEPSIPEITRLILHDPRGIFKILGSERYKNLLRRLYVNTDILKKDKLLWKEMRTAPFLLAFKETTSHKDIKKDHEQSAFADEDDETVTPVYEWRLQSAERIVILNDLISFNLFKDSLTVAPQEDALEEFYSLLGSPYLSTQIDEEFGFGPRMRDQREAAKLQDLIFERARLFLHDQNPNSVRHDIKWLESNLEVQTVQSIRLRRILSGQSVSHTEHRTAAVELNASKKPVLSITSNYDEWQVSYSVVSLLIDRPKPQTTMIFETFLKTPLLKLRARGYNVDRILRRKAAEDAKQAELEQQRRAEEARQLEEERKRIEELEKSRPKAQPTAIAAREESDDEFDSPRSPPNIPGAFLDSPIQSDSSQGKKRDGGTRQKSTQNNFLSSLRETLGFENRRSGPSNSTTNPSQTNRVQDMLPPELANGNLFGSNPLLPPPPPYTPMDSNRSTGGRDTERVTHPSSIAQNLQRAVGASRPYGSNTLFSKPETNVVKEVSSYCDSKPSHNLTLLGNVKAADIAGKNHAMKVFAAVETLSPIGFIAQNQAGLEAFAGTLIAASSVFQMPTDTIHIYYDESGSTIAFNSQGSVFCNYRFFSQLHLHAFQPGHQLSGPEEFKARAEALVYWWVTLCHELAHNLVSDHSSNHSFYTEQFVARYFPNIAGLTLQMAHSAPNRAASDQGMNSTASGQLLL